MLKRHEDHGDVGMYSLFSLSIMDEGSKKLFNKARANAAKAKKANEANTTVDKKKHHKNVVINNNK